MKKLLSRVDLRNEYTVYEDDDSYLVAGENRRGQRYKCRVRQEAVSYLRDRARGRRVTAERLKLPHTYGDKLRCSDQYVLIAAVALGHATVFGTSGSYRTWKIRFGGDHIQPMVLRRSVHARERRSCFAGRSRESVRSRDRP